MIHNQSVNNKINRIHKREPRIAYKDELSTFKTLLWKKKAIKTRVRNLKILVTDMIKVKNGITSK